jgi:hypothetical protein
MRHLLSFGATAAILAAGAVESAHAANPNVPQSSPYTMIDVDPSAGLADERPARQMIEGRSAYVKAELSLAPSDHHVARGDDIVIHARTSYLDPGTSANVGTENRYFYDTAHYNMNSEGPDFTRNQGGFENLPGPLGPN